MGRFQHTLCAWLPASGRRLGLRTCLRKGCGCIYRARRWNQRYCQEPECLKQVRRWQAAKRQALRRRRPEARQSHADAERQRRARRRAEHPHKTPPPCASTPAEDEFSGSSLEPGPELHPDPGAWSRSRNLSAPFCDRPGCYEAVRASSRCQARYCGDVCRQAVRRVRDRERKWLARNTQAGRFKRSIEYHAPPWAERARSP